ncbi:MAG TPA: hypothetical protein VN911_00820 [Candidatus Acidoferrum sp.]|jgi:hypothetical protein|nr:hypothetical protein [Candidatus Acidoferrum sp.]
MSANPLDQLEIRALQQRDQVHGTIEELKGKVEEARAKLDVNTIARNHLLGASLVVSAIGFLSGYGLAGLFTRR